MVVISNRSRFATTGMLCDIHHIARSVLHQIGEDHRIAGALRRLPHNMDHRLDPRCHPLHRVCNPFEVEGEGEAEGELIAEVVLEMVGQVMVQTMTVV